MKDLVVEVVGEQSTVVVVEPHRDVVELAQDRDGAVVIDVYHEPTAIIVSNPVGQELIEITIPGPAGPGVPGGGSPGQILRKSPGADYDCEWGNQVLVGAGDPPDPSNLPDGTLFVKIL